MKSTGENKCIESGVLVAQCAEGPAGLVGREPLVPEVEDGAPVLVDAADEAHAHVAVRVQPTVSKRLSIRYEKVVSCRSRVARSRGRIYGA